MSTVKISVEKAKISYSVKNKPISKHIIWKKDKSYILFINVPISGHIKYIIYQLAIIHKGLEKINSSFSQNLYQYMYLIVIDSKKIELFLKNFSL